LIFRNPAAQKDAHDWQENNGAEAMTKTKHRDMADSIAQWAESTPRIRRVWLGNGELEVAVELDPVGDSEETLAVWIANAGSWQSQLRKRVSAPVELGWLDPDAASSGVRAELDEDKALVYERAPLA
jgi:hypothetical protein